MAVTVWNTQMQGSSKALGASFALGFPSTVSAGHYICFSIAAIGGAGTPLFSDDGGNTYITSSGNSGGLGLCIAYSEITTGMGAGSQLTVTFPGTPTAVAYAAVELTGCFGVNSPTGASTGTSATPSVNAGSVSAVDDMVVAVLGTNGASGDSFTQDTDTLGGAWGSLFARLGTTGGSAASNVTLASGRKMITAPTVQVWDPTITSRLWRAGALIFQGTPSGTAFTQDVDDTLALTDSFGPFNVVDNETEVIVLSDSMAKVITPATFAETVALADTAAAGLFFAQNPADAIGLADALSKTPSPVEAEALALADSMSSQWVAAITPGEAIPLADALAKDITDVEAETVPLADATTQQTGKAQTLNDTAALADATAKDITDVEAEDVPLADATAKDMTDVEAEAVPLADGLAKDITDAEAEAVPLADSLNNAPATSLTDTAALADSFSAAFAAAIQIPDAIALVDATAKTITTQTADVLALADGLDRAGSLFLTDAAGVTDAEALTFARALAEAVGLADSAGTAASLNVVVTDALTLADLFKDAPSKALGDAVALSDVVTFPGSAPAPDITGPVFAVVETNVGTVVVADYAAIAEASSYQGLATGDYEGKVV